jgi:YegS/Rv2252/BmrU family lipid kinase
MKYFIIANPLSKIVQKGKLQYIENIFNKRGVRVEKYFSKYQGESVELAYEITKEFANQQTTIVSIGGDGTINEVCRGIIKAGQNNVSVGIIPGGTANVLAKEFNIPEKNLNKSIDIILKQNKRKVYLSEINDKFFLFTCGIGFDGMIVEKVDLKLKKYISKFVYILSAIIVLFQLKNLTEFKIVVNGNEMEAKSLIVNRTKRYAGNFNIFKNADIFLKKFDILIFKNLNFKIIVEFLFDIFLKKEFLQKKDYFFISSDKISLTTNKKLSVQIDGDLFENTPYIIKVSEDKFVNFIVP